MMLIKVTFLISSFLLLIPYLGVSADISSLQLPYNTQTIKPEDYLVSGESNSEVSDTINVAENHDNIELSEETHRDNIELSEETHRDNIELSEETNHDNIELSEETNHDNLEPSEEVQETDECTEENNECVEGLNGEFFNPNKLFKRNQTNYDLSRALYTSFVGIWGRKFNTPMYDLDKDPDSDHDKEHENRKPEDSKDYSSLENLDHITLHPDKLEDDNHNEDDSSQHDANRNYGVISGVVALSALSFIGSFAAVRKIKLGKKHKGKLIFIDNSVDRCYTFDPNKPYK